jgi:hypothetical protein
MPKSLVMYVTRDGHSRSLAVDLGKSLGALTASAVVYQKDDESARSSSVDRFVAELGIGR